MRGVGTEVKREEGKKKLKGEVECGPDTPPAIELGLGRGVENV